MRDEDHQLLIAMHRGVDASARIFWARQSPRLLAFARAVLPRRLRSHAEDVVQSVFCRLLDLPAREIESIRDVGAYLAAMTRHQALNVARSARRDAARHESLPVRGGSPETPQHEDDLARAIDALPRRLRETVVLKHSTGLSFDALADVLGLNRDTLASRYRQGLNALRATLVPGATTTEVRDG
ncbi:MAG: sigma-70 family RNA polymerase sigma factor [Planctomycetota bacterium]|nr:sigma-70 family RNA polymerase sigma factor [Planctomycetota bacterium]